MAYGTKYTGSFYNNNDAKIDVIFQQDGYAGGSSEIIFAYDPIIIHCGAEDDNMFSPIRATTATIKLIGTSKGQFEDFYTSNSREWRVTITGPSGDNYQPKFIGWILSDQYSEPYCQCDYVCELQLTDGLMDLKSIDFLDSGSRYFGLETAINIINNCLTKAELDTTINIIDFVYTFEDSMSTGVDDSPLGQYQIYQELFYGDNKPWSCWEVIESILKPLGACLQTWFQASLKMFTIFEPHTLINDTITGVLYIDGVCIEGGSNRTTYAAIGNDTCFIHEDTVLSYREKYKSAVVDFNTGLMDNYLMNGDFIADKWTDSSTPLYWEKSASVVVSQITNGVEIEADDGYTGNISTIVYGLRDQAFKELTFSFYYTATTASSTHNLKAVVIVDNGTTRKYYDSPTSAWRTSPLTGDIFYDFTVSGQEEYFELTFPSTRLGGYFSMEIMMYNMDVGAAASGTLQLKDIRLTSNVSSYENDTNYIPSIIEEEYIIDSNVKRIFDPVEIITGDLPDLAWGVCLGTLYDSADTKTYTWYIKGESYSDNIQTLLARKYALQLTNIARKWEGSVLNLSSNNYYNPLTLRDSNNTNEWGDVISMFPIYTEHHLEQDQIKGLWIEIKPNTVIT